jgi:hypothetical protein
LGSSVEPDARTEGVMDAALFDAMAPAATGIVESFIFR